MLLCPALVQEFTSRWTKDSFIERLAKSVSDGTGSKTQEPLLVVHLVFGH